MGCFQHTLGGRGRENGVTTVPEPQLQRKQPRQDNRTGAPFGSSVIVIKPEQVARAAGAGLRERPHLAKVEPGSEIHFR